MNNKCRLFKDHRHEITKVIKRLSSALTTAYYINWHNNIENRPPKCIERYNMKKSLTINMNYIRVSKLVG
jgi:hypothetical protein